MFFQRFCDKGDCSKLTVKDKENLENVSETDERDRINDQNFLQTPAQPTYTTGFSFLDSTASLERS